MNLNRRRLAPVVDCALHFHPLQSDEVDGMQIISDRRKVQSHLRSSFEVRLVVITTFVSNLNFTQVVSRSQVRETTKPNCILSSLCSLADLALKPSTLLR